MEGGLIRRQPWTETPQTLAWGPSRHGCSNEEGGQRPGRHHDLTLLCSFPTMTTPWKQQQGSLVGTTAAVRGHHGGYSGSSSGGNGSMDATMEAVGLEAAFEVGDGMRSRAPLCHSLYKESVVCKLIKSGYCL